jgi:hypothetical protein
LTDLPGTPVGKWDDQADVTLQQLDCWNSINGNSGNSVSRAKPAWLPAAPTWHVNAKKPPPCRPIEGHAGPRKKNILILGGIELPRA